MDFPWVQDGVTGQELEALLWFGDMVASQSPEIAALLLGYPWVVDGPTVKEKEVVGDLTYVFGRGSAPGDKLVALRWLADKVSDQELRAIRALWDIAHRDPDLANRILTYRWLTDDVTYDDKETLITLANIARTDSILAGRIAGMPWITEVEHVTSHVWEPLGSLGVIAAQDLELAWQLANFLSEHSRRRNRDLISPIRWLIQERPETFKELTEEPWFADGVNGEEVAFVVTMRNIIVILLVTTPIWSILGSFSHHYQPASCRSGKHLGSAKDSLPTGRGYPGDHSGRRPKDRRANGSPVSCLAS